MRIVCILLITSSLAVASQANRPLKLLSINNDTTEYIRISHLHNWALEDSWQMQLNESTPITPLRILTPGQISTEILELPTINYFFNYPERAHHGIRQPVVLKIENLLNPMQTLIACLSIKYQHRDALSEHSALAGAHLFRWSPAELRIASGSNLNRKEVSVQLDYEKQQVHALFSLFLAGKQLEGTAFEIDVVKMPT